MADIKPFKAIVYNQDKFSDLSKLICPPYDVIDSKSGLKYYNSTDYNAIHLILPGLRHLAKTYALSCADAGTSRSGREDKYAYAAQKLNEWIESEVLKKDNSDAVYFYEQDYAYAGERKKRMGFFALLRLTGPDKEPSAKGGKVYAHEHTQLGPKEDRLELLNHVKANLSPIFVLFPDKNHIISRAYEKCRDQSCFVEIECESIRHKLWRITDEKMTSQIIKSLSLSDVFIADGHHRYEVACNFRSLMRQKLGNPDRELPSDYVMAYFTGMHSSGLTILPTHRVVKFVKKDIYDKMMDNLAEYFDIYKADHRADLFIMLGKAAKNEQVLGLYRENKFFLLRLKSRIDINKIIDVNKPREYKKLAVVILNRLIIGKILQYEEKDLKSENLFYTDSADLAINMVNNKEAMLAFFVNPVKIQEMADLALQGVRLPPKSTFFYPKLPTGLLIYKFDGQE
ncbi:MAG: hypothetical protein COV72_08450 [Candidatus Omnitrophica bacterium CG11_big_fil_rev_8_21_14_0_20_42_13]|uniref:Phosphatase n=1 Tax=Candidatus Ghiorseimicrobium undicola TaxID=1974746 RepID=A0A2H0LVF3_9BACT|nr:MAG: hypothetical protein COV72_08450 [Candidatus Omnitrophica bacterium CG11_big_fil_rev_8_21_14_0_20_42_13]